MMQKIHLNAIVFMMAFLSILKPVMAEDQQTWIKEGKAALAKAKMLQPNNKKAKNIILFIGDGMGVSTVTGSRIFEGQHRGIDGERNKLAFEKLPYVALSKTYSANQQTPDSAPTMTAIVTGVKTNDGVLSLNQNVQRGEASNAVIEANKVHTILEQAGAYGLSTGIVSTARITHATPAATYAHISNRDWENNSELPTTAIDSGLKDIALQLLEQVHKTKGLQVILGGGRQQFMPTSVTDPEYQYKTGLRTDGRDLIEEFLAVTGGSYIWHKQQFDAIDPKKQRTC